MDETKRGPKPVPPSAVKAWKKVRSNFLHGTIKHLARHLGVKPPAVSKWPYVPDARVPTVAQFLGVEPWQLRPDIYAPPASPWADLSSKGTTK